MEVLFELACSVLFAGLGRARLGVRLPRSGRRVRRTRWLAVAMGALLFQTGSLLVLDVQAVRLASALLRDDLLMFLAVLLGPIAFFCIAALLAGTVGAVAAAGAQSMVLTEIALAMAAPAIVLVVALIPDAWRPAEESDRGAARPRTYYDVV